MFSCNSNTGNKKNDSEKKTAATVNGEKICLEELDSFIIQELYDELNRIYTIKSVALDELINQKLIMQEARKQNLTSETYLNNYTDSVIKHSPYDSLIIKYGVDRDLKFIHNVSLLSIPSQTYEGRMLQNHQLRDVIKKRLIDSLVHTSNIDKYLYPPQSPRLNGLEQQVISYRGNLKSKVTMLLISDFDCGKCIEFHSIYDSIYNAYKDRVRFGYINFSATPTTAIIASEVYNSHDKFWEFYDLAYKSKEFIDSARVFDMAKELNIDPDKFSGEFNSKELADKIENAFNALHQYGIYATPTIVINNRLLFNSGSYNRISELLNVELKK
jgi:hypothetical protein